MLPEQLRRKPSDSRESKKRPPEQLPNVLLRWKLKDNASSTSKSSWGSRRNRRPKRQESPTKKKKMRELLQSRHLPEPLPRMLKRRRLNNYRQLLPKRPLKQRRPGLDMSKKRWRDWRLKLSKRDWLKRLRLLPSKRESGWSLKSRKDKG
jgi:hypothetical protein